MANLNGNAPKDTYQSLLKLESNGMPSGSALKTVEAGNGDSTALELSDDDAKVNGTLNVTGATDLDSTLNVDGVVTLNSVTTDDNELTGLLIDANGDVVKREFNEQAFEGSDAAFSFSTIDVDGSANITIGAANQTLNLVAGNGIAFVGNNTSKTLTIDTTGLFQNPMIIAKPSSENTITSSFSKVPLSAVDNTTSDSSFGIKVGSEFAIDATNNEIDVANAGVFKIDVCLSISINTNNSNSIIDVELIQEDSGGNASDAYVTNERFNNIPSNTAIKKTISFSATRVFTAGSHIYVQIKESSGNTATYSLLPDTTIKIEKLAS